MTNELHDESTYSLSDGKITTEFSNKTLCSRCVSAFRRGRYLCKRTDRGDMKRRVCDNCGTLTMCGEFAVSVDRILTARHTARNNGRKTNDENNKKGEWVMHHVEYEYKPTIKHRPKNSPATSDVKRRCERRGSEGMDSTLEKAALEVNKTPEKTIPPYADNTPKTGRVSYVVADDRAIPMHSSRSVDDRESQDRRDPSCDTSCEKEGADKADQEGNVSEGGCVHPAAHRTQGEHDPVNHPSHYCQGGIECIDAIQAAVTGLKGMEAVCVGNVIRYIWRWKWKNGKEDLHKARFYLNKLILLVEAAQKQSEQKQTEQEQTKQKGWVSTYAQKESTNGCGR